ncbi:MAG: hypothetical protein UT13_C0002G0003 [Candidatus Pacebacteria bacterium GW2011_GWF2_38_9]|nr:MAG: hypothetical protein UT13_C0002G0003 [Candidatus Pacebacteria bacterium GW2011_GWF2_38_9]
MKLFNKGKRIITVKAGVDEKGNILTADLKPNSSEEVEKKEAERLLKLFPNELIAAKDIVDVPDDSALKTENEALKEEIGSLKSENITHKSTIQQLNSEVAGLKEAKDKALEDNETILKEIDALKTENEALKEEIAKSAELIKNPEETTKDNGKGKKPEVQSQENK